MKTVKDYNLPLSSLTETTTRKNKHCAVLPSLCRHCQSKAQHSRIWAQDMPYLPIKQVYLWPSDLESGVRVTCDVGYLCANFSLPRPLCSRFRPDVRERQIDRQTSGRQMSDAHHCLMRPPYGGGGIIICAQEIHVKHYIFTHCMAHSK